MLTKLIYILILMVSLVLPVHAAGENGGVRMEKATPGPRQPLAYRFTHYDDHNGLSQWHLTKILQDKRGFLWFATWNGLNRYDGYDFSVFKSQRGDGSNLTSDRIRNMQMGDDGNIYCVINEHVWRFNLTTYRFEKPDDTTSERYLARLKSDTEVHKERPVTVGGRLFNKVRQVFMDSQRNAWVMVPYGVYKASPAPQPAEMVTAVPNDIVRCIYVDRKKRIWVSTRNQGVVTVLDSLTNLIGYLGTDGRLHPTPTRFKAVYCITQQSDGTIWMGTKPDGLFRMREQKEGVFAIEHFQKGTAAQVKRGETINSNDIYDIKEDRLGRLWIATHGGGLNMLERTAGEMRYHNNDNTFKNYPALNVQIRRLMIVGDSLLLATTTEGLLVAKHVMGAPGKIDFNVHVRESDRKESLSCSAVMDMLFDRKGRFFVSTESGGVNMLLTKDLSAKKFNFRNFDTTNGMGSDVALAMAEVGDEILVQCNNQVTRINADVGEVENFNDLFFSIASRFSDAEPILMRDGRWLLTLETGLMIMPEQLFHQRSYVPRIVLTSYSVPGRPVNYTADVHDTIRLATPSERNIIIQYAALDYTDNSHIKYVTRMRSVGVWNASKDSIGWTAPQEARSISFYDLSPGTYLLEIRSTNAEGLWTDNTRKVYIIVEPTFWETPFAYFMYVLLTIGFISGVTYTIVYIRTLKRQREDNLKAYLRLFEQRGRMTDTVSALDSDTVEKHGEKDDTIAVGQEEKVEITIPRITEEDDAFMRRLMTFVEENLSNSGIGVDEMAAATATSRSSLNRKTKSLLGVTPADFLKEARMKRACQQLVTTARSVNDIAYSCGFSDPKYFSKCFKASIGMSPTEYRTKNSD